MNTAKNTTSHTTTSRFGSVKSLGRGIVVASAVALGGVSTLSAADASAAGVATGVRYAGTNATQSAATSPSSLAIESNAAYRIVNGKITRA